jgi:hypothetical protein
MKPLNHRALKAYRTIGYSALCISLMVSRADAAPNAASSNAYSTIKFGELYKMPVGPEGLEPSEAILSLEQQRVSLFGYVVAQNPIVPGRMILSPLPISIDDEDESLADDLPPTVVFVHFDPNNSLIQKLVNQPSGTLLKVRGILSVGQQEEVDGRVSSIRLTIE